MNKNIVLLLFCFFENSYALKASTPIVKSFKYVGATSPLGYFDPLKLSYNKSDKQLQYLREAELQHSRIAMASIITFPVIEYLFKDELAVNFLAHQSIVAQIPFWFSIMLYEVARMRTYWEDPFKTNKFFSIKKHMQPGNLFKYDKDSLRNSTLNKELNNGRLAMISIIYMMLYEVGTQHRIFDFF